MKYLLDSNVCIEVLRPRGDARVAARIRSEDPRSLSLCAVVVMELTYGALRSGNATKNLADVEAFCAGFDSVPFDDAAAVRAAHIDSQLSAAGVRIGGADLLIAARAIVNGMVLVSHNVTEFSRVPGLAAEDWQVD